MKLEVRVEINVDIIGATCPTAQERSKVWAEYEPTPDGPYPDDWWLREQVAITRLKAVTGVTYVAITDILEV